MADGGGIRRVALFRLLLGAAAYVPGLDGTIVNRGTGGSDRAPYCYDVWMKHLVLLWQRGIGRVPDTVAELGPGDSLGVGLAALLSGASAYLALDVKRFATRERNLAVFDELVGLFRGRAGRHTRGWPEFDAHLDGSLFPSHILDEARLAAALHPDRVASIRHALLHGASEDGSIVVRSIVPWDGVDNVEPGSVDLILSHSVLEHVRDLDATYAACAAWLRPGGWMSHQVDFTAHGLASRWNGCWAHGSGWYWELLAGRRDCWINRQPCSAHLRQIESAGFEVETALHRKRDDGLRREQLAADWAWIDDEDLGCSGVFIEARKPGADPAGGVGL